VQAQEKLVLATENEDVKIGDEFILRVQLPEQKTAAFQLTLNWDNTKLMLLSQNENMNVVENRIYYLWYDTTGGKEPKTGDIATFHFRANKAGSVHFAAQGKIYDLAGNEQEIFAEKEIEIQEDDEAFLEEAENTQRKDNTNLENLAIENALLYPSFETAQTSYTAEVGNEVENLKVLAIPEQEQAKVVIQGTENLQVGENTVTIQVIAPSGNQKQYRIRVYRRNVAEEEKYKEEQAQMPEKLKQAYEIEKISTSQEIPQIEEQKGEEEEVQKSKKWETAIILMLGVGIGILWYAREQKRKKK